MAYALFDGLAKSAGASCSAARRLRRDVEPAASHQPRPERRRQRRRRRDDSRCRAAPSEPGPQLRPPGYNPNADINNDCKVNALDLELRRAASASPSQANRDCRRARRSPSIRDGRAPDCLAAVQRRRAARRHRHRPLDQRRRDVLDAHRRRAHQPVRPGHDATLVVPHQRLPDDDVRRRRPRLPGVVGARLPSAAAGPGRRRCAHRALDLDHGIDLVARRRSTTRRSRAIRSCRRSPSRKASCNSSTTTFAKTSRSSSGSSSTSSRFSTAHAAASVTPSMCVPRRPIRGDAPFTAFRLSQYKRGVPGSAVIQQLEFSPPNLPLFRAGTSPFMGDYIDVAPEVPFVRNGSTWSFNTAPSDDRVPRASGPTTVTSGRQPTATGRTTRRPIRRSRGPHERIRSAQALPACVPGQAGMRNQNVYTAAHHAGSGRRRARQRSAARHGIQRSFPVFAQNNAGSRAATGWPSPTSRGADKRRSGSSSRSRRSTSRCRANQRSLARCSRDRAIRQAQIASRVTQNRAHRPANRSERTAGHHRPESGSDQSGSSRIRISRTRIIENPDIENAEIHNPDIENATARNPDIENPDIENPDIENPDIENTTVVNPTSSTPISKTRTSRTRTSRTPTSRIPTSRTPIS